MCAQIILPIDLFTRSKIIGRDVANINTILRRYRILRYWIRQAKHPPGAYLFSVLAALFRSFNRDPEEIAPCNFNLR